jgi:subtilisin family serine protease
MITFLSSLLALSLSTEPAAAKRVIVEFHGVPAARAGARTATSRETHERFRRDLVKRSGVTAQSLPQRDPVIRHEYSAAFLGAAVELSPADVARVAALPYVKAVHPDRTVRALATDDEIVDAAARVNAGSLPTRGRGVTVAVIDTGIDYTHPDLGSGFGPGFKVASGWDFVEGDADPMDDQGHGTHVAAIIASNGPRLFGVAPEATLIAYKSLSRNGTGTESDVIAALDRSVDPNGDGNPADHHDVINMSLGGPGHASDPMARASDNAVAAGVIVVVAAGNEGGHIASVGTPGAARDVITVGAHDGTAVADFSSRGPTPGALMFKPDVVAPGVHIFSAKVGGGYIVHSGTSMAAPHAAGVCALLRALHPEWTPADMKAALVSTAVAMSGGPLARGTGRIDAVLANDARVLVTGAGLSFGLLAATQGRFEETRSFAVENRSPAPQTLALTAPSVPNGVSVAISPSSLTLAPNEKRSVEVRLTVDNAVVPFADDPHERLIGGDVVASGTSSFRVPWAFVRSARVTLSSHDLQAVSLMFEAGQTDGVTLRPYKHDFPTAAEIYIPPGKSWSFTVSGVTSAPETLRLVLLEDRPIGGDEVIIIRAADAPLRIAFATTTADGTTLAQRPAGPFTRRTAHVEWKRQTEASPTPYELDFELPSLSELFVSPAPAIHTLQITESMIDLERMEAWNVQHATLRGFSESKTLMKDVSSLLNARLQLEPAGTSLTVCRTRGDLRSVGSSFMTRGCVARPGSPEGTLSYYTTEDVERLVTTGMQVRTGLVTTPSIRAWEGSIIAAWDALPSAAAMRIPNGGVATIGSAPAFPFAVPGTTGGVAVFRPRPGFTGSFDEDRGAAGYWTLTAADGTRTSGTVESASSLAPAPGARLQVSHAGLRAARHASQGLLDVVFGSNEADLAPPTLTSLRIVDSEGRNTDRLAHREAASLRFSAADFDYTKATQTLPSRPEATRAWVRAHGSSEWIALPLTIEGSESGNANSLRHLPAGDLYRADLAAITAVRDTLFDLRIDLEDPAGNRATWTQSPAFAVGNVEPPRRRRAAR